MPQDRPPLSRMVFVSYDTGPAWYDKDSRDHEESEFLAKWTYQRLKYAGYPVRTYIADEAIGGGGFGYNSIAVASPLIAVVSSRAGNRSVLADIESALQQHKDVVVIAGDSSALTRTYPKPSTILDFSDLGGREAAYQELTNLLSERTYPVGRVQSLASSGVSLSEARRFYSEFARSDSQYRSDFYHKYFYTGVFGGLFNRDERIQALHDLGELRILKGIVLACLQDDPDSDVRVAAALALRKYDDFDAAAMLAGSMNVMRWTPMVKSVGLAYAVLFDSSIAERTAIHLGSWHPPLRQVLDPSASTPEQHSKSADPLPDISHDVFVSYSRADSEDDALDLVSRLTSRGFKVWIDTNLEPGSPSWLDVIEREIRRSRVMVALTSPGFFSSEWTRREIFVAHNHGIAIIPIKVVESNKPMLIAATQGLRGDPLLRKDPDLVLTQLIEYLRKVDTSAAAHDDAATNAG